MRTPSQRARADLDEYITQLAQYGDGLTLEEFRLRNMQRSQRTQARVRRTLYMTGTVFMLALLAELFFNDYFLGEELLWASIWAMSLGGLGAIASVFLLVLKLVPQPALNRFEEMEVFGRIFLGCLFSLIFALTVIPGPLLNFYQFIQRPTMAGPAGGVKLLLPFLCGYSIPLVLGILGKAIQAVEITLGFEDRRGPVVAKTIRRRGSPSAPASR